MELLKPLFCLAIVGVIVGFIFSQPVAASEEESLVFCSLNADNLGATKKSTRKKSKRSRNSEKKKLEHLARRISQAKCDIVAVQEVYGPSAVEAARNLRKLELIVEEHSAEEFGGKKFKSFTGETLDRRIRNGFLVAEQDGLEVIEKFNFAKRPLPRDLLFSRLGYFSRGPFGLLFEVALPSGETQQILALSIHLKSKSGAFKDPTQTKFERLRVQMAQGVREIVSKELSQRFPEALVVIAGDLNSERSDAASKVLEGSRSLSEFSKGQCRIDTELEASCSKQSEMPPKLTRLFAAELEAWPEQIGKGSYKYKGRHYLIDEIIVSPRAAPLFRESDGSYDLGFEGKFYRGSDHKLLWARMALKKTF